MTMGPLALVQSVLDPLFQSPALIVEHAETAGIALQKLAALPRTNLPKVLIMPWLLPVVRSPDFVRSIKASPALRSMSIIVWGAGMSAPLIQSLYKAGATCVIPCHLDKAASKAVYHFCTKISTEAGGSPEGALINNDVSAQR